MNFGTNFTRLEDPGIINCPDLHVFDLFIYPEVFPRSFRSELKKLPWGFAAVGDEIPWVPNIFDRFLGFTFPVPFSGWLDS